MSARVVKRFTKHDTYQAHAVHVCKMMAKLYLEQFNRIEKGDPFPSHYLHKADAMRDLQYLTEFFKIMQFDLEGDHSRTW